MKIALEIRHIWLKDIKPWRDNPRDIENEALEGLRHSLEQFGYIDPLIVNKRNMELVSGHQRLNILKEKNLKRIACVMVDVDSVQQQAMSISLNNQQIAGYWTAALMPILEKLRKEIPDDYINLRMDKLRDELCDLEIENSGAGKTLPDDIPEIPKKAITKPGDLYILGEHRLLCGDSTKEKDVKHLMGGSTAKLFATDPPYMVDYTGADRPTGGKDWSNVYHEVEIEDAQDFMYNFLFLGLKYIEKNTALYIWHAERRKELLFQVCRKLNILPHQPIIWVKPCPVLTFSFYSWRHEPCLLAWQKGFKPPYKPSNISIGTVWTIDYLKSGDPTKPEYYTDVWELDWEGKKRNTGLEHPTVKPTEVFAIPMRVHTKVGDICYEPFCGSGSQIIAAERLNRRCFAMELEPIFIDVSVRRWEDFTGRKAKRITKSKGTAGS